MEKQNKSPEEITFNRRFAGFKRSIKANITEYGGLRKIELELEFFKKRTNTPLPKPYFTLDDTIRAIEEAIKEYKDAMGGGVKLQMTKSTHYYEYKIAA